MGGEARPLRTLGRWLVGLLILSALADLLAAVADLDQYSILQRLDDGEDVSFEEVTSSDDFVGITGLLQTLMLLITVIVWLIWFRRAYRNIPIISDGSWRYKPGWAVGAWFVPFLNLWRPKKMANDIWRAGDPTPAHGVPFHDRPVSSLLHWWWALWIISNYLANAAARLLFRAETVPDQMNAAALYAVSDVVSFFLSLLAAVVVSKMTTRHEARREEAYPTTSALPEGSRTSTPPSDSS